MNRSVVSQTVILAAGSGSRLSEARGDVPKPLMHVAGVPLIAHALAHAKASGCHEAIIVVGYAGDQVKAAVQAMPAGLTVRFVESPDPTAPNGVSLLAAEPAVGSAFFLQMVDHLFGDTALSKLAAVPLSTSEAGRVLVDRSPGDAIDLSDATKVRLDGGRVMAIGKGLDPWHAIDAGCFLLTPAVFEALRHVPIAEPHTVSSGMRQLVARGLLGSADVEGLDWVDVDTPADCEIAERLLARRLLSESR
jgi:1L-myo-inositol 1-phosphate cytidylyltransferase